MICTDIFKQIYNIENLNINMNITIMLILKTVSTFSHKRKKRKGWNVAATSQLDEKYLRAAGAGHDPVGRTCPACKGC